ncbi:MAG: FimB/Mfa2 family fimbrial subunit [Parabacteroides sp.]|nr:FimB/Mfa2 family fimbrial subunit [Parabacteroides sp.]
MKKGNLTSVFALAFAVILSAVSFTSCLGGDSDIDNVLSNSSTNTINSSKESDNELQVEAPFSVVLRTLNVGGEDLTTKGDVKNVTLFVFDEEGYFVKQIAVEKSQILNRKTIEIACPGNDKITVIAWGGLSENEEFTTMSPMNIISNLQVKVKENNGVATATGDLFYGQVEIKHSSTKSNDRSELALQRKVSSVSLSTEGLAQDNSTYEYRISKSQEAFDANGELTGEEIEYAIPASFNKKGVLVADSPILPASNLTISLYKDGQLVFSAEKDQNGKNLSAKAGKQQNLVFDKNGSNLAVNLIVADFGVVVQYVIVG